MLEGVITALVTPFTENGEKVDFVKFRKQIDFQIDNGIKSMVFLGTTGESATLSHDEKIKIIKFAVKYVHNRATVIIGTGGNNTAEVIKLSREAEKLGADALLVVTPFYNKCTDSGLIAHFEAVASSVDVPIVLYNVPSRTGVNMKPDVIKILAKHPNIIGIKEASGNMGQMLDIASFVNNKFSLISGDDGLFLPTLAIGGCGVISVASNVIPSQINRLYDSFIMGDMESARQMQREIHAFIKSLFKEVNPIPIKCIMKVLQMDNGHVRAPLTPASSETEKLLIDEYKKLCNDEKFVE